MAIASKGRQSKDLAAILAGGRIIACSNQHYGAALNLLMPDKVMSMGDGWETRRRREPGHDWVIVALGALGRVTAFEVITDHFKGNFPAACSVQGASGDGLSDDELVAQSMFWSELLSRHELRADAQHKFAVPRSSPVTHVRFNIYPDGGVGRLRIIGTPV